jgi:hypothetical protein
MVRRRPSRRRIRLRLRACKSEWSERGLAKAESPDGVRGFSHREGRVGTYRMEGRSLC